MCFARIFHTNALWQSLATSYFVFNFYNAVSSSKYWYLTNYSTHTLPPAYIRYYSGISHKNPPLFLNNKSGGITHDTATFALALKIYQKSETIPIETGSDYHYLVRMVGLELTRGRPRKILSLVRLPFRHMRRYIVTEDCPSSKQSIYYHLFNQLSITFFPSFQFCHFIKFLGNAMWYIPDIRPPDITYFDRYKYSVS